MLDQQDDGRYTIGRGLRRLGWSGPSPARLGELCAARVSALAARLNEGVVAVRLAAAGLEVIAEASPEQALMVSPRVLREVSPYAWAAGRALLAAQGESGLAGLVARYGQPEADWPEARGAGLAAELARVQAQGWAYRRCARSGVHSLARAVRDPFGGGLLALGVYVPATRFSTALRRQVLDALAEAVAELESHLAREYAVVPACPAAAGGVTGA